MSDARIVIDADAGQVVVEAGKAKRAINQLGATTRQQTTTGAAMAAAGRRQTQTLHELGRAARRATLILGGLAAAGMADVIKTGVEFEKEMSRVKAVLSATGGEMEQLNKLAMKMGADTKFSAAEASKAMYELASAGFTVKEMGGAMKGTLALAAASSIELADAAEISSNALRGFGLESEKTTHVADVLAKTVNQSSVEMNDLQFSMKYIGPIARSTGQSFEQMVAALGIMGDAGIKGEQAGTTLRGGLIRLVKPTKMVQKGFREIGMSAKDLQGPNGLRPLGEIIAILAEKTEGMEKAQRNQALAQIFGTEALSGMLALIDEGPQKLERFTRANERANGAALKASKTMQDNVAGAFEQLTGSIETVEIALYQQFQEPLKEVLLDATREVNTKGKEVTEFFDRVFEMPDFKAASLGGKLQILLDELDKTGLPDKMGDLIVEGFVTAIEKGAPLVAKAAGALAVTAARGFFRGFEQADPVAKVIMALFIAHKTGMIAAIRAAGAKAGAAYGTSAAAAAAATGGAAVGGGMLGARNRAKGAAMAKGVGLTAVAFSAADAATAADLNAGERAQQFLSFGGILGESGREHADKADKAIAKLRDRLRELANQGKDVRGEYGRVFASIANLGKADDDDDWRKRSQAIDAYENRLRAVQALGKQGLKLDLDSEATNAQLRTISTAFDRMSNSSVDSIKDVRRIVRDNMRVIAANTKAGSADAKAALASNFRLAADAVRRAMKDGTVSTKAGLAEIERLMGKALQQYGFSAKQAKNIARGQRFDGGPNEGAAGQAISRARGGLTTVGRKGAAGRDTVPALLNGQPAIVAEGEDVAVINRHQRAELDQRLADQGGLAGFFARNRRPHYMARGGIVPIPGQPGESIHRSILPDVLRIVRQYNARVTDGYATSGHAPRGDHPKGLAVDLVPGPRGSWDQIDALARWAEPRQNQPRRPFRWVGYDGDANHGRGHHLHLSWLVGAAMGGDPMAIAELKRVKMQGGLGAVTQIGQAALDTARGAAQKRLEEVAGSMGLGMEGGESMGMLGGGPATGNGADLMRRIAQQRGWNFDHWWEIDRRETSHGANLANPTSTARLRGQFLDMNYGKYGPGSDPRQNPSMAQQIESMAQYIAERYGNPSRALAHHNAHNWYAGGGLVGEPMAGGGMKSKRKRRRSRNRSRNTLGTNRTPRQRAKARGYKPGKAKFRLRDINELTRFQELGGKLEDSEQAYRNAERVHGLTDEQQLVERVATDPDGTEYAYEERNEPDIARRVGEIDQLIALKAESARWLAAQQEAGQVALRKLADGIRERVERINQIKAAAKANIERIHALHKRVAVLDRDENRSRRAISRAKGSKAKAAARRAHVRNVRANRPVRKQLSRDLDALRDTNERLVGSRSVNVDLDGNAGGLLGTARDQMGTWGDERSKLAPDVKQAAQNAFDVSIDIKERRKERAAWSGTQAPPIDLPKPKADPATAVDDNKALLADLLRQQLTDERQKTSMLSAQFDVFKGFAPMIQARMVGSFLQGGVVPRTGLAYVHEGETFLPRDDGPFRMTARDMLGGGQQAAPQVTVIVEGELGPFVKRIRAEIDGRAAKVVSQQIGRNARLIAAGPGGR